MSYAVRVFASLPSTNAYVKDNARYLRHADVIAAKTQINGRGRLGRKWISNAGGLYFTIYLKFNGTSYLENMTQILCVAICRTLEEAGVTASIKWPNDVLVGDAKIAGILSETIMEGNNVTGLALGAGINVSQKDLQVPGKRATTLAKEGVAISEGRILDSTLRHFFTLYFLVVDKGFSAIHHEYISKLTQLGEEIEVAAGARKLRGTFLCVNSEGRLVLGLADSSVREICMGEVI